MFFFWGGDYDATFNNVACRYNASEHPIPFYKAIDLGKAPKKLAGGPMPDLEEAFDVRLLLLLLL